MTLIKQLKLDPENQVNFVDILQTLFPVKKTKYVDLFLKLVKKTQFKNYNDGEIVKQVSEYYGVDILNLKDLTPLQTNLFLHFIDLCVCQENFKSFLNFIKYNERGLILQKDLSKYTSFDEITRQTSLTEIKLMEKDLRKQIKTLYSDDEWFVLRPLTYNSSLKYGSATKWCTSSSTGPEYFYRYSKGGVLIYIISRISGKKIACFKSLDKERQEISFWNQVDERIDSMEAELPDFILKTIKAELKEFSNTNYSLLSDDDKIREEEFLESFYAKHIKSCSVIEEPIRDVLG